MTDGQSVRDVLQADPDCQRNRRSQLAATEAHADGHPFRKVVQRHRKHQRRAMPGATFGPSVVVASPSRKSETVLFPELACVGDFANARPDRDRPFVA
jgi:hypothetical protein